MRRDVYMYEMITGLARDDNTATGRTLPKPLILLTVENGSHSHLNSVCMTGDADIHGSLSYVVHGPLQPAVHLSKSHLQPHKAPVNTCAFWLD